MNAEPVTPAVLAAATATTTLAHEIASHPFLHGLKPRHQELLAESAIRAEFPTGKLIFHEGEPANRFYLIESGRVALESHLRDEPPVEVQIIGAGEALGWSWLFPPCHWSFDARVLEPTTAIFFYGSRLRVQCELDHEFGYELMKRMAQVVIQRLQHTRRQLLEVSR
jgi:CRP/FNR family cyclic AMP-dependent transcriptional regulator